MKTYIEVRTRFEGFHRWHDAPDEVDFLRNRHRHEFHVRARILVGHDDRELEFILVKRYLTKIIESWGRELGSFSCEMMASTLANSILAHYGLRDLEVEVSEDGENGAVVAYP